MLVTETARQLVDDIFGFLPEHRKQLIDEVATKDDLREFYNHSQIVLHLQVRVDETRCLGSAKENHGHALNCSGRTKLTKVAEIKEDIHPKKKSYVAEWGKLVTWSRKAS